jgi:hypothetical protein
MAPAFLRSLEKVILGGVREHAIDRETMNNDTNPERADERAHARRDALLLTITGPLVTATLLAAWAAAGAGYFWPVWPMLGMSIAVLVALYRAFGPLPQAAAAGAPEPPPAAPPM